MPRLYRALVRRLVARRCFCTIRGGWRIEALETRRLLSVSIDAGGWTQITPGPADHVIYVSASTGNDSNDGLSPDRPVASLAVGVSRLRDRSGDELLLKAGDTWHSGLGIWRKSGSSAQEPLVIGSYGAGPRPLLMTGAADGFSASGSSSPQVDHVAILGIDFYADGRDPASPTFSGPSPAAGIEVLTRTDGLLIENCRITGYSDDINVEEYFGPIQNVSIRRNVIVDAYAVNAHSQGLYANGIDNLLIEGNVFDHDGYNDLVPGAEPTWFNHDAYLAANNSNVTVQDNIFAEAAGYGLQERPGGLVQGNLFLNDPVGMSFGLVNGAAVTPGGVNGIVNGNVFQGGANIGSISLGEGMEIGNTKAGYPSIISNNIFTQGVNHAPAAITLAYGKGDTNPQDAVGLNDLTIQGNIVYDWYDGVEVDSGFNPGHSGSTNFADVRIQKNDFQQVDGDVLTQGDALYQGQELWTDNRYSSAGGVMISGKKSLDALQWDQSDEPGGLVDAVPYADAQRTVESYDAALGGPGTLADFLALEGNQSQQTWQPLFDASAVISYFRDGFEEVGAAAHDWRAPTPPIAAAAMPSAVLDRDTTMKFSVTYTDDKAVDPASIASGGVSVVLAHGKSKWSDPATLVSVSGEGATLTATYSFTPPGGSFKKGMAQRFALVMNGDQVRDTDGFPVTAGSLGSFRVRVMSRPKPPIVKRVQLVNHNQGLLITFSSDVSRSIQAGDLVLTNDTGEALDPATMILTTSVLHKTALWSFAGEPGGALPPGIWHVRLLATTLTDAIGQPLDGNHNGTGGDDYVLLKPLIVKAV